LRIADLPPQDIEDMDAHLDYCPGAEAKPNVGPQSPRPAASGSKPVVDACKEGKSLMWKIGDWVKEKTAPTETAVSQSEVSAEERAGGERKLLGGDEEDEEDDEVSKIIKKALHGIDSGVLPDDDQSSVL
jgi:hypothetical protein